MIFQLKVADKDHWQGVDVSRNNAMPLTDLSTKPFNYQQQQDAVELFFEDNLGAVYLQTKDGSSEDLHSFVEASASLEFELKLTKLPTQPVFCCYAKSRLKLKI